MAERLLDALGEPTVDLITGSPSADLIALWLAVARRRAARRTPAEVVRAYTRDAYVAPVSGDPLALRALELTCLQQAAGRGFEPIELSPLAPLGSCSTFSLGGQDRVLSTARGLEVLADPTNVLALECVRRRRAGSREPIALATAARVVRCQPLKSEGHTRHFSLFAAATAGRDRDSRRFAVRVLADHVALHRAILEAAMPGRLGAIRIATTDAYRRSAEGLADTCRDDGLEVQLEPLSHRYYHGLRFQLLVRLGAATIALTDGGLFDWMRTLASDRKEQFVASATGTELLAKQ
ncbi:MAG: hypothetical protein AAF211_15525, partial [Myxococcota bacterium]